MKNIYVLTDRQRRFLASPAKQGFSNNTELYNELTTKADYAIRLLKTVSDPEFVNGARPSKNETKEVVFLPQARFERMLPKASIEALLERVILGQKRSENDSKLDLYGAELAYVFLDVCLRKLTAQWRTALIASGQSLPQIDVIHFDEDSKNTILWADKIFNLIKDAKS